jgi:hypothetical protein
VTTTTTAFCGPTSSATIIVQVTGSGTIADGQYVELSAPFPGGDTTYCIAAESSDVETPLLLDAAGHLSWDGFHADVQNLDSVQVIYFNKPAHIMQFIHFYVTCVISCPSYRSIFRVFKEIYS